MEYVHLNLQQFYLARNDVARRRIYHNTYERERWQAMRLQLAVSFVRMCCGDFSVDSTSCYVNLHRFALELFSYHAIAFYKAIEETHRSEKTA